MKQKDVEQKKPTPEQQGTNYCHGQRLAGKRSGEQAKESK